MFYYSSVCSKFWGAWWTEWPIFFILGTGGKRRHEGKSHVSVSLDDGRAKNLELGSMEFCFVSQKQSAGTHMAELNVNGNTTR